jgi:hypothetical protein
MNDEPRNKRFGDTMSDYIVQVANELPYDAVGMWQIVPGGRHDFDLEGDALTDYVRRCVAELLSHGAVPVFGGGPDGPHDGSCSASTALGPRRSSRMSFVNGSPMALRTRIRVDCGSLCSSMRGRNNRKIGCIKGPCRSPNP